MSVGCYLQYRVCMWNGHICRIWQSKISHCMNSACNAFTSSTNYRLTNGASSEIGHVITRTNVIVVRQTVSPDMWNEIYSGVSLQRLSGFIYNETTTLYGVHCFDRNVLSDFLLWENLESFIHIYFSTQAYRCKSGWLSVPHCRP